MAYADQQEMSTSRIVSIIIVLILHALLGYGLVTGLAYKGIQNLAKKMNVIDVKEEKPPEEKPPPEPDKQIEPPVVSPPPLITTISPPSPIRTVSTPPPFVPLVPTAAPPAPSAPPPPPPPPVAKRPKPVPKGNQGNWVTTNDYPNRDLQQEHAGVTSVVLTVGPDGKVAGCSVTSSSGFPGLDQATCSNLQRRARFDPALDGSGNPTTGSFSKSVRWQIPKE